MPVIPIRTAFSITFGITTSMKNLLCVQKRANGSVLQASRSRFCRFSRAMAGFTLIELMISIAIVAILLAMAVPSFQSLLRSRELAAETGRVRTALSFARNEAITRKQHVVVCPSSTGTSCAASNSWSSGWMIFVDINENGLRSTTTSDGEIILRVQGVPEGQVRITSGVETSPSTNAKYTVRYNESGSKELGVTELRVCAGNALASSDTEFSRTIDIANSGSARMKWGTTTCP